MKQPLDLYDYKPQAQKAYLQNYGWHFSKKACQFAVGLMKRKDADGNVSKLDPWTKEQIDEMLTKYGIRLQNKVGYDYVYAANMCKADYFKRSISDEQHVAMYIRDVIDDVDACDGNVMRMWYASMVGAGMPIEWEDLL